LGNKFIFGGEPTATSGGCAPEIERLCAKAASLTTGSEEQKSAGSEKACEVFEQGHSLLDWEVLDVVVECRDVELLAGGLRANITFFDFDTTFQSPRANIRSS
jgi:hypothetical protein